MKKESGWPEHPPYHPQLRLLQTLFVGLDHLLDHLAADGAGFPGGQIAVVAVLQVDTNLPWCPFYILNSPDTGIVEGSCPLGANSLIGSDTISPMNL